MGWRRPMMGWALAALTLFAAGAAQADSTTCSDPQTRKPGVRAELWLAMPPGGAPALENPIGKFAERELSMSISGVGMEDPYGKPMLKTHDLILQSPDVSVAVHIESSNRTDRVRVTLERTCYYDAIVPWQPYWTGLTALFSQQGYRIVPRPAINLRRAGFLNRGRPIKGP